MRHTFEYFKEIRMNDSIDIESIGDCVISAMNDSCDEYILITKTNLGNCKIIQFGPINTEIKRDNFAFSVNCIPYNEGKIIKTIQYFLNTNDITQALESNVGHALEICPDLKQYIVGE